MNLIKKANTLITEELTRLRKAKEQFAQQVRDLEAAADTAKGFLSRTVAEIEELEQHLADVAKASLEPIVQVVERIVEVAAPAAEAAEAEAADDLQDILGAHDNN